MAPVSGGGSGPEPLLDDMSDNAKRVAEALGLPPQKVDAALALFTEGNTVPFVARYRKERTGHLDETQLRQIAEASERLRKLDERRSTVLASIQEQGALTRELERRLQAATTLTELEDLYAPYKPKRQSRARKALEAGLEPVARAIASGRDPAPIASRLRSEAFPTVADAVKGGQDILAEEFSADPEARRSVRATLRQHGKLTVRKRRGSEEQPTYADYYGFSARVDRLKPHQALAIRRGEAEGTLSAGISVDEERTVRPFLRRARGPLHEAALRDGYERLLRPAVERDVRRELDDAADAHAIHVFAINLGNLLLQAPLTGARVLGVDPGYRTGCKAVAVDASGQVLGKALFYVHDGRRDRAPAVIRAMIDRHRIDVVAVGNGTASTEAQAAVAQALEGTDARYAVVDEAGASVYSASELAVAELPDLDVSERGAVSIARRLQDPLAELVKIDPRAIGVGLYQHDVDQARLARALDAVVEDAVNGVGVDLQTASVRLLTYVSGIGPTLAERIVAHRASHGFQTRADLRKVKGIGAKTFEQCAGFLRVRGPEPLDATAIHPESYPAARALLQAAGVGLGDPALGERIEQLRASGQLAEVAARHGLGRYTLADVLDGLLRPGRDPRADLEPPVVRSRKLSLDELTVGTRLSGTVRNVVDFGAFIDVGLDQDGLVHVSKMARRFVRDPHEVVAVGDRVEVTVVSVDRERGRIGLSLVD